MVPVLTVTGLYLLWPELPKFDPRGVLKETYPVAQVVAFLAGAGLVTDLLKTLVKLSLKEIQDLAKKAGAIPSKSIFPSLNIRKSIKDTYRTYYAVIPCRIWQTSVSAWRLALTLIGAAFLVWMAYPMFESVQKMNSGICRSTIFPLTFKNVNLENQDNNGICLEEHHMEWINDFRQAITESFPEEALTLKVVGFASRAPMRSNGIDSDILNCEVANIRANVVGAFLASPERNGKRDCNLTVENFRNKRREADFCKNDQPLVYAGKDSSWNVHVHQWTDSERMNESKPVEDADFPRSSIDS